MPSSTQNLPPQLNLPVAELSLRSGDKGVEVYDELRQKWLLVTPEEWVRQHFVHFLMSHMGVPRSLMANELGIRLNGMSRRCDTVVFDRALSPLMIVEYKAPDIKIDRKVIDQVMRYNTVLKVPYLVVSNGLHHYCIKVDADGNKCQLLTRLPRYEELT
ncbi:type I restriction enzyme HsdR N-terminal domain-containing protein [uncultured Duncaniella sp.]|uniref:type I restriction enzyme HsdR N-terminal domain-containing protein n=1 Tax=uncultured Duncaniella sp. TaxID=2768039 RepID=UPI0025A98A8B|nr:type I restriction enzyme HsdR N-terminal domain-containing protein [uncultured Duncaniella sp.]